MGSYTYAIENLDEDEYFDVALIDLAMPWLDDFAGLQPVCDK